MHVLQCLASLAAASAFTAARRPAALRCLKLRALGDDVFPSTATDVFVGNLPYSCDEDVLGALVRCGVAINSSLWRASTSSISTPKRLID